MTRKKLAVSSAVLLTAIGLSGVMAVQPAAAHAGKYFKERSGCTYSGGTDSFHSYAWTRKDKGSCKGHAWIEVRFKDGTLSGTLHASDLVEVFGPIARARHKSQSNEAWVYSHK